MAKYKLLDSDGTLSMGRAECIDLPLVEEVLPMFNSRIGEKPNH
jgi:hypothetical protein